MFLFSVSFSSPFIESFIAVTVPSSSSSSSPPPSLTARAATTTTSSSLPLLVQLIIVELTMTPVISVALAADVLRVYSEIARTSAKKQRSDVYTRDMHSVSTYTLRSPTMKYALSVGDRSDSDSRRPQTTSRFTWLALFSAER